MLAAFDARKGTLSIFCVMNADVCQYASGRPIAPLATYVTKSGHLLKLIMVVTQFIILTPSRRR